MIDKSEQINELASALSKAQAKFKHVAKDKTAKIRMKAGGEYSYNYADLGSTWDVARGALTENGLSVVQLPSFDSGWLILDTMLMHASGQYISSQMRTRADEMDVKSIGSAITYLRRYAFSATIGLVADEDDDGSAPNGRQDAQAPTQRPASYNAPTKHAAPATNGNAPVCPVHKKPMRQNPNTGNFYCATKLDDGSWCKERPASAAPVARTLPDDWDAEFADVT